MTATPSGEPITEGCGAGPPVRARRAIALALGGTVLCLVALSVWTTAGAAQSTTDAGDASNASLIYTGERVEGIEGITDFARTDDGGLLALKFANDTGETTVVRVSGDGTATHGDPIPGTLQALTRVGEDAYVAVGERGDDALVVWLRADGSVRWTETYGGDGVDKASDVVPAPDGDAYVLAATESFGVETSDLWVLRVAGDGTVHWDRRVAHESWTAFPMGSRLADGDLVATIRTERSMDKSVDGDQNVSAVRIEPDGTVVWRNTVVGEGVPSDKDEMFEVLPAHGDGVLLAGLSNSGNDDWHPDFWAVNLGADGEVDWQRHYDTYSRDYASSAVRTADGYVLAGFTWPEPDTNTSGLVVGIGPEGDERFRERMDTIPELSMRPNTVDWTADGRLVLGGLTVHMGAGRSQAWIRDVTDVAPGVEPGPSTWSLFRDAGPGPTSDGGTPVDTPDGSGDPDGPRSTDTVPAATASGDSTDDVLLFVGAALSFVALFAPYGVRRWRRR